MRRRRAVERRLEVRDRPRRRSLRPGVLANRRHLPGAQLPDDLLPDVRMAGRRAQSCRARVRPALELVVAGDAVPSTTRHVRARARRPAAWRCCAARQRVGGRGARDSRTPRRRPRSMPSRPRTEAYGSIIRAGSSHGRVQNGQDVALAEFSTRRDFRSTLSSASPVAAFSSRIDAIIAATANTWCGASS